MSAMEPNSPECDGSPVEREMTPAELFGWLELGCWTMVALAPFLYWVNGPAVSTDQFVVRTALVSLALCGGIGIRLGKGIRAFKNRRNKSR